MSDELNANQTIVPVRMQKVVDFYGDSIVAAQGMDETIYVPLRPLCDHLGLDWSGQAKRIKRDPLLATATRFVSITTTEGYPRSVLCLPLKLLPGFLFGVQAARVRPELRDKILRYQEDCYEVLWNAFKSDILPPPPGAELSGAALAYEIGTAIQNLARQQLDLEDRLGQVGGRQEVMAEYLRGFIQRTEGRLTALELQLSSGATISEDQAGEIALAVKNVGKQLERQGDRQGYAKVYAELYRRYRISSYKHLPTARYQDVLDWLHGWFNELERGE